MVRIPITTQKDSMVSLSNDISSFAILRASELLKNFCQFTLIHDGHVLEPCNTSDLTTVLTPLLIGKRISFNIDC